MAWAKPRGTYIISRFSAVSVSPNHLPKVGESGPQIDDRVPQRAAHAAHDLDLGGVAKLVMHAAQGALGARQRIVHVDEAGFEPGGGKFPFAEHAGEKAAVVAALFQLDHPRVLERRFVKFHPDPFFRRASVDAP